MLLDSRGAAALAAKQRQTLAEHAQAWYTRHPGLLVGFAVVLNSAVQRGVFTAIMWVIRAPLPVRAFESIKAAEGWLVAQLRESGARRPLASGE